MEAVLQDIRHAFRRISKNPGFAAIVPTEHSIVLKKRKRQARGDEICWVLDFCARIAGSTNKVPHKGRSADRLRR
jgi:hypothetical protein